MRVISINVDAGHGRKPEFSVGTRRETYDEIVGILKKAKSDGSEIDQTVTTNDQKTYVSVVRHGEDDNYLAMFDKENGFSLVISFDDDDPHYRETLRCFLEGDFGKLYTWIKTLEQI